MKPNDLLTTVWQQRALSSIEIKSFDDDKRTFEGIASTPQADRMEDEVMPLGAEFKLPIPFLHQHNSSQPIGLITEAKVTKTGIFVKGHVEKFSEPPSLKDRVDTAWQEIKSQLVRGLSIGFKPLETEPIKGTNGIRFLRWSWLELSAVTIAANASASITNIKSIDDQYLRAASGDIAKAEVTSSSLPGVTGKPNQFPKGKKMKTYSEQITDLQNTRAAKAARMQEVMKGSAEDGRSTDAAEGEEFDTLDTDISQIDKDLVRLQKLEKMNLQTASPVFAGNQEQGSQSRQGVKIEMGKSMLPPGVRFTRFAICQAKAKGNLMQAEILSQQYKDTPEVNLACKAAVAAGTTQDATWAAPLVQLQEMQSEFVEFLRPMTLLGRIPGLRRVPFNIKFTRQTSGTTGTFVGEGLPKPVGKMDFELLSLTWAKAATIIVMTDELIRFSNPSAEALARDDLAAGIARYLDLRFIDPAYAGVANVSPASITNGVTPTASLGTTIALVTDTVEAAMQGFVTGNQNLGGLVWIMNPGTALSLSLKRTSQDVFAFPNLGPNGGTFFGYPVITSNNVALSASPTETFIVLMNPSEIMLADDGGVSIDMSNEASIEMDSAPTGGATSLVSLWQNNMTALRAERYINWMKRRSGAVAVITMNVGW